MPPDGSGRRGALRARGASAWRWARERPLVAGLGAVAVVAVVVLMLSLGGGAGPLPGGPPPTSLADPVPYDGRSPAQPPGDLQRVLVQMPRPALGELKGARAMGAAAQQTYVASLKREAITTRSALQARGVVLRGVVAFYRVWNGFAATVRSRDIARLNSRGTRVRTVRRLYPATSEAVPVPGAAPRAAPPAGQAPVALLDTGVALPGATERGYDAVDRDRHPAPGRDPSGTGRAETSGTALAGVLAAAGERVLPIRVAGLRAGAGRGVEVAGGSDELLAGLEHAVDPNGDADTSDHVAVALVGVNAPYAGFSGSPEAQAVRGAAGLGTLVVAPAGNEAAARRGTGTVGSPAGAPDALAVGALEGPEPSPRVTVDVDGERLATAVALGGTPPPTGTLAGPVSDADPAALARRTAELRGKVVLVRAGANPAAQAAAASAAGARAVVLADPRDRALPAVAAGRAGAPAIGVTGAGAKALLDHARGEVRFGAAARGPRTEGAAAPRVSPATAEGPSAGGLAKPEIAAPATALTAGLAAGRTAEGGGAAQAVVVGGTGVAAARVAAAAAALARARPELSPAELRAAVIGAADPAGLPPERAGAGAVRDPAPAPVTADPPAPFSNDIDPVTVRLSATATTPLKLAATAGATPEPATLTVRPGAPAKVTVRLAKAGATGTGRLVATANGRTVASVPWLVRPLDVPPIPLGRLRTSGGRRVSFTLGAFSRGDPLTTGTDIQVAERLVLDLVDGDGRVRRTLTVPGGARELMPAEYAYTLPRSALADLPPGRYAFRARAWAPRQRTPTTGRSAAFRR